MLQVWREQIRAVGMGRASVAFPVLLALVGPTVVASFLTPAIGQRVLSHSATAHRRLSNGWGLKMLEGNAGEIAVAGFLAFNMAYVAQLLNKPRSKIPCFQLQLVLIFLSLSPCITIRVPGRVAEGRAAAEAA